MTRILLVLGAIVMATPDGAAGQGCTPETIIVNAKVHTVDRARPSAEAVAICGELIHRVGTTDEIRKLAGPKTRVIDAAERLVIPGFNDAHVHLLAGANELVGVDLRPAKDEQDMARRLAAHAATLPKGEWIVGGYWDHEAWPSKALPTRQAIDAATPNNPVFVQRLDGHMALANSLAITLAGVTRATKSPDGGTIVPDAAGEPAGVFKDNAMGLVNRVIPPDSPERLMEKAKAALRYAASLGVTTIQDMTASPRELEAYRLLEARGELTARIYSMQNYPGAPPEELQEGDRLGQDGRQETLRRRLDGLRDGGVLRAIYR